MFFVVIPQSLLVNEELNGYININSNNINIKININDFTFYINGYLFYQINEVFKSDVSYYIYNYNQITTFDNFNNMQKTINNKGMIFSNNIIVIKLNFNDAAIVNIKAKEQTYMCKKLYFNKNKEFIIEYEYKTMPAFDINFDLFLKLEC